VIRSLLDPRPPALEEIGGIYAGAAIDADGRGIVVSDPLSLRFLYRGRGASWTVVSSNPHLAAWGAVSAGERPERDALHACSLAATGYRLIPYSGYVGVELLRPGSYVELRRDAEPKVISRAAVWWPTEDHQVMTADELLEQAGVAVAENVAASLSYPADLVVADLTGGKDSRLILAGALSAGVAQELIFFTRGPQELPDVAIARELAEEFGFTHGGGPELAKLAYSRGIDVNTRLELADSWTERARNYAVTTAGMDNIWQGVPVEDETPVLQLGGLFGEALRSALPWTLPSEAHLIDWFDRRINRLCLLRPESRRRIRDTLIENLVRDPTGGKASYEDLHDWYLLEMQIRRNFGPREEMKAYQRQLPAYALDAVRAGFALGGRARMAHLVHWGITNRASPALAAHRYVDGGWPGEPQPTPPIRGPRRGPPQRWIERPPIPVEESSSLGRILVAHQREERLTLVRDLLAERDNPAWDHIDARLLSDMVGRYEQMATVQQLEVIGAATAAIWLSRDS
jgi:hypothetical protein